MEVKIIRSKRKTIVMGVMPEYLLIKAPLNTTDQRIRELISKKQKWIDKQVANLQKRLVLNKKQIEELRAKAKIIIPSEVNYFAKLMGVSYGKITIRNMRSRWGSCSSCGDLSFNCLLMLVPEEVRKYVVIHELCHRLQMNHSVKFWAEVAHYCPNYKLYRKWLRDNGSILIQR